MSMRLSLWLTPFAPSAIPYHRVPQCLTRLIPLSGMMQLVAVTNPMASSVPTPMMIFCPFIPASRMEVHSRLPRVGMSELR
jgi:hypothetical protein